MVIGNALRLPAGAVGAILCFGLRLGAIHGGWHLPIARPPAR